MQKAIALAQKGMENDKGGPFGALIVKNGTIIGEGNNKVTSDNDPTAHAEIIAIRMACKNLQSFDLSDCEIYTSCEPCPMCLGAIYWANIKKMYYACNRKDAANIGFSDEFIYEQMNLGINERTINTEQIDRSDAIKLFQYWDEKEDKVEY